MNRMRAFVVVAVMVAAGGCGSGPVVPDVLAAMPEVRPTFNGYTYGSGSVVAFPDETTSATASATVAEDSATMRGGYTYGSGN